MQRFFPILLFVCCVLNAGTFAFAKFPSSLLSQETLSGHWCGRRSTLQERGLTIQSVNEHLKKELLLLLRAERARELLNGSVQLFEKLF